MSSPMSMRLRRAEAIASLTALAIVCGFIALIVWSIDRDRMNWRQECADVGGRVIGPIDGTLSCVLDGAVVSQRRGPA